MTRKASRVQFHGKPSGKPTCVGLDGLMWTGAVKAVRPCTDMALLQKLIDKNQISKKGSHFSMNCDFLVLAWEKKPMESINCRIFFVLCAPLHCFLFWLKQKFRNFQHLVVIR